MPRLIVHPAPPPPAEVVDLLVMVHLDYRGADRGMTRRAVTVHRATGYQAPSGEIQLETIHGYCHLRRMARAFRIAQVSSAATEAGEVIPDLAAWILRRADSADGENGE